MRTAELREAAIAPVRVGMSVEAARIRQNEGLLDQRVGLNEPKQTDKEVSSSVCGPVDKGHSKVNVSKE